MTIENLPRVVCQTIVMMAQQVPIVDTNMASEENAEEVRIVEDILTLADAIREYRANDKTKESLEHALVNPHSYRLKQEKHSVKQD